MEENIRKYEEVYNKYIEEVDRACNCIESNPCKKVSSNLDEIIRGFNTQITNLNDWDDSAKDTFVDNIKICIKNLETLRDNVNSNWANAENIYKNLKNYLNTLNGKCEILKNMLNNEPKKDSYKKITANELGEEKITYPGYATAYSNWNTNCNEINNECIAVYNEIIEHVKELENINGLGITLKSLSNFNILLSQVANLGEPESTTYIPSDIKQAGYTVTCYESDGWHLGAGKKATRVGVGTGQKLVHDAWNAQGSNYRNGIAVIDDNGVERILVACSSQIGKVGDRLTYTLENGDVIHALVADQKSAADPNYDIYGHRYGGSVNILELEVNTSDYKNKGNPNSSTWDLWWDSSSKIVNVANYGSAKEDLNTGVKI